MRNPAWSVLLGLSAVAFAPVTTVVLVLPGAASLAPRGIVLAAEAESPVTDTSWTEPNGQRVLEQRVVVAAAPARVWEAFATADGFISWAVPQAKVDFRLGGLIETTYDVNGELGGPGTIQNQITAFVPGQMLAFRNVRAPENAAF